MLTFLLTWNPTKTSWPGLGDDAARLRDGETVTDDWSTGSRKRVIGPGDRFFMLRQEAEPRGIMASGTVDCDVQRRLHWNDPTKTANFVDITFDALVDPDEEPDLLIPMQDLLDRFGGCFMRVQGSGKQLPDDVAEEVEQMWTERVGPRDEDRDEEEENENDDFEPLTEQVSNDELYVEGAVREVSVNAYERSAGARQACVEHWGTRCCVCRFDFEAVYGELGGEYEVDPINDLRPICPNCHAMIHRQEPPLSVEELR